MRSGPGAAMTILLFHIISARPSKQPRMVRTLPSLRYTGEYVNSGLWRKSLFPHKISNKMKKISYEPRRNFFLSQIVKNLLRKWSVFVSTSNNSMPRTHCRSPAAPLASLLAMNVFGCRGGKKSKVSQRGALNLPSARKSAN